MNCRRFAVQGMAALLFLWLFAGAVPDRLYSGQSPADRIIPTPEFADPFQVTAGFGRLYVADDRSLFIYDFNSGRFLKKVGQRGQGPGEFTIGPGRMTVFPDRLVVADFNRIKFYSLDGIYRDQLETPSNLGFYPFLPVGRNFVGFPMERKEDGSVYAPSGCIFGPDIKFKNAFFGELPQLPGPPPPPGSQPAGGKTDTPLIREYGDYTVYKDRIYVADSRKGGRISVFDDNGAALYEIRTPLDRIKVPRSFVEEVVKEWKASKYWDRIYAHQNPVASEHFPSFINFKVKDDRIYLITAAQKDSFYEVIVMDLKGKILERSFRFPLKPTFATLAPFVLKYDFEGGRLIWYAYNDAKETYELHIR
jgi:hypothetical protein